MMANTAKRHYENFDPFSEIKSEKEFDTLLLHLPGFKKEQLSVQLTSTGILKIRGERPVSNNKWKRFHKEFQLPSYIDTNAIITKYLEGILYIRQPKLETFSFFEQGDEEAQKLEEKEVLQPQNQTLQQEGTSEAIIEEKDEEKNETSEAPKPQEEKKKKMVRLAEEKKDEMAGLEEERKDEMEGLEEKGDEISGLEEIKEDEISGLEEGKYDKITDLEDEKDKQVDHVGGIIEELRRPEHLKRLAVNVIVLLVVFGYFISRMFISVTKKVEEPNIEYDKQEL